MIPKRSKRFSLPNLDIRGVGRWLMLSALVGLVAGCGALAFYYVTNAADHLFLGQWAGYHPPAEGGESVPTAYPGGVISTLSMSSRWFLFLLPVRTGPKRGQKEVGAVKSLPLVTRLLEAHIYADSLGQFGGVPVHDVQMSFVYVQ